MAGRFPFALKLSLSFTVAILVSVAAVYFLTTRAFTEHFGQYYETARREAAGRSCCVLAEFRVNNGAWSGVENILSTSYTLRFNNQTIVRDRSLIEGDYALADDSGTIVAASDPARVGTSLSPEEAVSGIPVANDDELLGTLVLDNEPALQLPEQTFLATASRSALVGGSIAAAVALFLSGILLSQVLSPLRLLSRATERVARGDLSQRVALKARDEFGRLGESFNRMIDNLRRSERVRQTMTADIAHELRTPVTIIQGNLEAILDGVYQPTPEAIAPVYEETLHLGRLIDDLRDLALAEAGELSLNKEPTDLLALVHQVADTVRISTDEGPALKVKSEPTLPIVSVDPKRIHQILANLLGNALRATPPDGEIHIRIVQEDRILRLQITDTGPGIAPEDLPHVFERFYRGDRARTRASGGSGLGLAIVKQLVESHGGRVEVTNAEGGGARFTLLLPLT